MRERTGPVDHSFDTEQFRAVLLAWFERHKRDLPWRRTRDPYAIWISEIMLQQTRVAAVVPYYERFLARFPNFPVLAEAPEEDLLAHWAGLGYYRRARNLQKAAQSVRDQGAFPATYESIRALPGIGEYTGAAIASIAFDLPYAAVDGNVMRVLSRLFAEPSDVASAAGRARFSLLANEVLDRSQPGIFNQAMMELGATVCIPADPHCLLCPVSALCVARQRGRVREFPVKLKREKSVIEERSFFWVEQNGSVLLWQRPRDARLMPGFYELPERAHLPSIKPSILLGEFRHTMTFHNYRCRLYLAEVPVNISSCRWVPVCDLARLPASTLLRKAERLLCRKTRTATGAR